MKRNDYVQITTQKFVDEESLTRQTSLVIAVFVFSHFTMVAVALRGSMLFAFSSSPLIKRL